PEPVDVLEIANTRDPFTFTRGERTLDVELEPILIFARPQGQSLDEWHKNVLPLSSLLGVLAELLEFLRRAHDDGLVLNGLCPAAVIVDRAERVHYVGSDMVIDGSAALGPEQWRPLFPAERYARGYAPPECFHGRVPDRSADLYAWGWLAYTLLTGDPPRASSGEHDQGWTLYQAEHAERLRDALSHVPPVLVRNWAEQLGVDEAAFAQEWPDNVLAVFRLLLAPEREQRPQSVSEL